MLARIPFEEAIAEPLLLKRPWEKLSIPQQTVLLVTYGQPLPTRDHVDAWRGLTERVEVDELGYPVAFLDQGAVYTPESYREVILLAGRRGGKTLCSAFMLAYETGCGAHEEWIASKQQAVAFFVSQDQRTAIVNLNMVKGMFEDSPILRKQVAASTAERIDLRPPEKGYGRVSIICVPPKVSSMRGPSCPAAALDELVAWSSDPTAADPDEVIYGTLRKAQMTFPDRKLLITSSVGYEQGLMWKMYQAGTKGEKLSSDLQRRPWRRLCVMLATSAGMGNPLLTREDLEEESTKDDFPRECLSQWQKVESGALETALVEAAVEPQCWERPPIQGVYYQAAIDAAFRSDSFVLSIFHLTGEGELVQDVLQEVVPESRTPLDPSQVLAEIVVPYCRRYGISVVQADQWQAESLAALLGTSGLALDRTPLTAGNKVSMLTVLTGLLRQRKLKLLDNPRQTWQLTRLRKVRTEAGGYQIRAPKGEKDDIAMTLLLMAGKIGWMQGAAGEVGTEWVPPKVKTEQEECWDQAMQTRFENGLDVPEEWLVEQGLL